MILGQIATVIASLLHKSTSDFVKGTGGNQVNMLHLALNNARRKAEQAHDFAVCRQRGYLTISTSDVDWTSDVTWWDENEWVTRKVQSWQLRTQGDADDGEFGGTDISIRAITKDLQTTLHSRNDYRLAPFYPDQRYPSDAVVDSSISPTLGQTYAVIRGNMVGLTPVPTSSQMLILDGFVWWQDWDDDADDDWWTQRGSEYLTLQGLVEANRLVHQFVGGQAGNLPPPSKEADLALGQLIQLDKDSQESSMQIFDY